MNHHFSSSRHLGLIALTLIVACDADPVSEQITYHTGAKAIIDAKCAGCHQTDGLGPFAMTTFEEVERFKVPAKAAIETGAMPPWQPADGCSDYTSKMPLTPEEKGTLLAFFDNPIEGQISEESNSENSIISEDTFDPDLSLKLPTPFQPTVVPDDYRCQIIEWPVEEEVYITGISVSPDKRALVHHAIVFMAPPQHAQKYRDMDKAQDGPGYTCFGGPTASAVEGMSGLAAQRQAGWIGAWVPGAGSGRLPDGLGIKVKPGSILIVQMHYNLITATTEADQSTINIAYEKEVEKPAMVMPFTDVGWITNGRLGGEPMTIPAGEPNVEHSTLVTSDSVILSNFKQSLGVSDNQALTIYTTAGHMHLLGQTIRLEVERDSGNECLLDIPEWDFNWQGNYQLSKPVRLGPQDRLRLSCSWDNSAANQMMIDGALRTPTDVKWGDGTTDEMCLGVLLMTAE